MNGESQLDIQDFSGGMTDQTIGRATNMSEQLYNLELEVDKGARVRPGSIPDGVTDTLNKISSGVELLVPALSAGTKPYKLTTGSNKGKLFYFNGTTHAELTGPSGNSLFTTAHGAAADHQFVTSKWAEHLFITSTSFTQKMKMVFLDSNQALCVRNASLPKFSGTPTWTNSATAGSFLYALVWKYTRTCGARTIIDRSAPFFVPGARSFIASSVSCTVGSLVNSGGENYWAQAASANESMVLELYRTTDGGNIYYLAGSSDYASPTVISDGVTDAALVLSTILYTASSVARDESPIAKFFHITETGYGIYAYLKDGNDTIKTRVGQSLPNVPGSMPATFFDDADDDEMTGISSYQGVPILFGTKNIYRGEGQIEPSGAGTFKLKKIVNGIGCINHNPIVQTFAGVFFASGSGFFWTDGYSIRKISDELNDTYATAFSTDPRKRACTGTFDETNLRVFWSFQDTGTSDSIFVFHLRFGVKENAVFSIWGGQSDTGALEDNLWPPTVPTTITQNFQAKGLLYSEGTLYRGDSRGYTFSFDPNTKTDPRVDTSVDVSAWGTTYIFYDWRSVMLNFGTSLLRKWTSAMSVVFKNRGDLSVSPQIDRDQENQFRKCREMKVKSIVTWAQDGLLWGDPALWSSQVSLYLQYRRFPARKLRCTYRQVRLTNAFTTIQKSDNLGLASLAIVGPNRTAQLVSGSWPTDVLDYYLTTAADNYVDHFLITARTASTLTVSDPNARFPTIAGNYKWEIRGYAKGQVIDVKSVSVPYIVLTDESQTQYRPGTEGNNA